MLNSSLETAHGNKRIYVLLIVLLIATFMNHIVKEKRYRKLWRFDAREYTIFYL